MIFLLFLIAAVLLFGVCYLLLTKHAIFFSLIPENTKNQTFLTIYGYLHGVLGILAIIVAFLGQKIDCPRLFSSVNDYFCLIQFAVCP